MSFNFPPLAMRMKNLLLILALGLFCQSSFGQGKAEAHIRSIMSQQESAWNTGDIEGFMNGYWESENLMFIGKSGVNRGWQTTLDNYKRSYPDKTAMGTLTFDILQVDVLNRKSAFVIGKWHLQRDAGDLEGHYTLLWKKVEGEWVIVADHSS